MNVRSHLLYWAWTFNTIWRIIVIDLIVLSILLTSYTLAARAGSVVTVQHRLETQPHRRHSGDFTSGIYSTDPSQSLIITMPKNIALGGYDLAGNELRLVDRANIGDYTVVTTSTLTATSFSRTAENSIVLQSLEPQNGIWISGDELAQLPTSGLAWDQLKAVADEDVGIPDLSNPTDGTNVAILAKALVYARTGMLQYRDDVMAALSSITSGNTENGGTTLTLGRNLAAYVIAADLIGLANYDPNLDFQFRNKLRELLTKELDGRTLRSTHEDRPNNWGNHAGASRAAVAVYLGDTAELQRTAQVFKGYLGDRSAYAGFVYGDDLSWQCNPDNPVGVNPIGCIKEGHSIDGALPEEMRRGGSFQWPPQKTGYAWEGLQGALVQAEILHRAGYPAWEWEDQALLRAVQFLHGIGWEAEGDDEWQPWLINYYYGTSFPVVIGARPGKNMGWTDWTHGVTYSFYLPLVFKRYYITR